MDGAADRKPLAGADPGRSGLARGRFIHWLAWGIAPDTGGLAEAFGEVAGRARRRLSRPASLAG
jgi:phosphatidylethanolamine-binding protein (PEBP) family uncharacterized protein